MSTNPHDSTARAEPAPDAADAIVAADGAVVKLGVRDGLPVVAGVVDGVVVGDAGERGVEHGGAAGAFVDDEVERGHDVDGVAAGGGVADDDRDGLSRIEIVRRGGLRDGGGTKTERARKVGALLAQRAKQAGLESVVFDRGGFEYAGRVQALADAAREEGLVF